MPKIAFKPLISVEELKNLNPKELLIADVRFGPAAKDTYCEKHLKEAVFVDMETDLSMSKKDFANGGRHPLPLLDDFAETLGRLGITASTHVVIYDDKNGAMAAARFWWMLKAVGHERVQVLNGGLQAAEQANFPLENGKNQPKPVETYPIQSWQLPQAERSEVSLATQNEQMHIVDVRSAERYGGDVEPIDPIAGHIQTALNIPFQENLDDKGFFLSADKLRVLYKEKLPTTEASQLIFHCGSGVSACHSLLAFAEAGFEMPKLYVGSWGEWCRANFEM